MPEMSYEYERFCNRDGFNRSLGHFQAVSALIDDFEDYYNLADILNSLSADREIEQGQLSPILYALLADKYGYISESHNMKATIEDFEDIRKEIARWKAVDIVIAYHHPELGFTVINPKNKEQWSVVQSIKKNELIILYAGAFQDDPDKSLAKAALSACAKLLEGAKVKPSEKLLKGKYKFQEYVFDEEEEEDDEPEQTATASSRSGIAPPQSKRADVKASETGGTAEEEETEAPVAAAPPPKPQPAAALSGNRRMTPMYAVPVTNELFHNGNVEAWKKIIQSYELKYPGTEVLVFYEGERIHDINTLFKWGKVKHGSTIMFAVVGEEMSDVAKLQRYFKQGASIQFEAFLKAPVNTVLELF